jgi:hypothetical protein
MSDDHLTPALSPKGGEGVDAEVTGDELNAKAQRRRDAEN